MSLTLDGTVGGSFPAGSVSAPSLYLSSDTTTGLYRIGANNTGFAISGTKLLDLSSALFAVTGAATISTTLGVTGLQSNLQSVAGDFQALVLGQSSNATAIAKLDFNTNTSTPIGRLSSDYNQGVGTGGMGLWTYAGATLFKAFSIAGAGQATWTDNANTSAFKFHSFMSNSAEAGSITRVLQTAAVTYNTSSDYRLKDNQAPLTGSGEFIDALKPKTWEWVSGGKAAGFIAHEFAEVSPSSVTGEKDGTQEEEYEVSPAVDATFDEDGKELTPAVAAVKATRTVPLYQGMQASSSEVIANMVAELQSLRSRVALLEAK